MNSEQSRFLDALWSKFSSYHTLVRVVARIRRFLRNSRSSTPVKIVINSLLPKEISDSKALLFKLAQLQSYPDTFQAITKQKSLPKNHPFLRFIPSYTDAGHLALHTRVRDPSKPLSPCSLIPLHAKSLFTKLPTAMLVFLPSMLFYLHPISSPTFPTL